MRGGPRQLYRKCVCGRIFFSVPSTMAIKAYFEEKKYGTESPPIRLRRIRLWYHFVARKRWVGARSVRKPNLDSPFFPVFLHAFLFIRPFPSSRGRSSDQPKARKEWELLHLLPFPSPFLLWVLQNFIRRRLCLHWRKEGGEFLVGYFSSS